MLHLITGLPGSGKSFYSVDTILKLRKLNEKYERSNPPVYKKNTDIIEANKTVLIHLDSTLFVGDQQLYKDLRTLFEVEIDTDVTIEHIFSKLPDFTVFSGGFHETHFKSSLIYNFFIAIINKQLNLSLKEIQGIRQIYADISGLLIDDVLPTPDDWRLTPDGSAVFYDEAQKRQRFQSNGRESISKDAITAALAVHRHTGHEIYLITQDAAQLHKHILSLTGHHVNISRPLGSRFPAVFEWSRHQPRPDAKNAQKNADSSRNFSLSKDIFKYYRSTTVDTHKFQWGKLLKLAALPIIAILFISYFLFFTDNHFINTHAISDATGGKTVENPLNEDGPATQHSSSNTQPSPMTDERLLFEYESKRIAFVIDDGNNCRPYNTYGEFMRDVPYSECRLMSDNSFMIKPTRLEPKIVKGSSLSIESVQEQQPQGST